jgi:hypothetical protein
MKLECFTFVTYETVRSLLLLLFCPFNKLSETTLLTIFILYIVCNATWVTDQGSCLITFIKCQTVKTSKRNNNFCLKFLDEICEKIVKKPVSDETEIHKIDTWNRFNES